MRIAIDANEANVENRVGSNTFAYEVLKRLPNTQNFSILLKKNPLDDLPKSFSYEVLKPAPYWTQFALPIRLVLNRNIDLFYTFSHYAPRYCPVPEVITIYDLSFEKFPEYFNKSDLVKLKSWTSYSVKKADHIITISNFSKNDIMNFYNIPEDRITVAYPGFDNNIYKIINESDKIEQAKEKYGIKSKYIVFVGTLQPRKNLPTLLDAIKNINNINLVIIGKKGWLYEGIFNKVKELGLEKRVIFTNYIPEKEIALLLNGAECLVLPSLYEGFGIPVVESMACGCPVVASNVSSLPEIVSEAGALFPPKSHKELLSCLENIINDVKYRKELSNKGLERARQFNWDICTQKIVERLYSINS